MKYVVMFAVALFLIDAALLGNIGSILGAIIDPANMVDVSANASSVSGTQGSGAGGTFGGTK